MPSSKATDMEIYFGELEVRLQALGRTQCALEAILPVLKFVTAMNLF